jgi:hypothetical protein
MYLNFVLGWGNPKKDAANAGIRRSDSLRRTYRIQRGSDRRKTISGITSNVSPVRGEKKKMDDGGYQ